MHEQRGVAQSGLAHLPWEQGVGGSNPLAPTNKIPYLKETLYNYTDSIQSSLLL